VTPEALEGHPVGLPEFEGAVLAGGSSRRMGSDKATLILGDGKMMGEAPVHALVEAGAAVVRVIGGDPALAARAGVPHVADEYPGQGPLGGLLTALNLCRHEVIFLMACDMPRASPSGVGTTLRGLAGADVAVPLVGGQMQYLHSAWRVRSLPALSDAFSSGIRSLAGAMETLVVHTVRGLAAEWVADMDTPEDLDRPQGRGATRAPLRSLPDRSQEHENLTPKEIQIEQLIELGPENINLIDVREHHEYEEARVPGVRHIPLAELPDRVAEIPGDDPVHLICAAGGRSMRAAEFLETRGFDAVNIAGGTKAWIAAGQPVESGPLDR
jgi:molybdopterin-guanine dinucleotide biosynthesis protein A